jgi:pentatricopeptide repeat protein
MVAAAARCHHHRHHLSVGVRPVPQLSAKSKIVAVPRPWFVADGPLRLGIGSCAERVRFHVYALQRRGRALAVEAVFGVLRSRTTVSWNRVITGCVKDGRAERALEVFETMVGRGVCIDRATVVSVLPVCALARDLHTGRVPPEGPRASATFAAVPCGSAFGCMFTTYDSSPDGRLAGHEQGHTLLRAAGQQTRTTPACCSSATATSPWPPWRRWWRCCRWPWRASPPRPTRSSVAAGRRGRARALRLARWPPRPGPARRVHGGARHADDNAVPVAARARWRGWWCMASPRLRVGRRGRAPPLHLRPPRAGAITGDVSVLCVRRSSSSPPTPRSAPHTCRRRGGGGSVRGRSVPSATASHWPSPRRPMAQRTTPRGMWRRWRSGRSTTRAARCGVSHTGAPSRCYAGAATCSAWAAACSALGWPRVVPLGGRRAVRVGGGEPYELANPTAAAICTAKGRGVRGHGSWRSADSGGPRRSEAEIQGTATLARRDRRRSDGGDGDLTLVCIHV